MPNCRAGAHIGHLCKPSRLDSLPYGIVEGCRLCSM
jgi:hypothetical protein